METQRPIRVKNGRLARGFWTEGDGVPYLEAVHKNKKGLEGGMTVAEVANVVQATISAVEAAYSAYTIRIGDHRALSRNGSVPGTPKAITPYERFIKAAIEYAWPEIEEDLTLLRAENAQLKSENASLRERVRNQEVEISRKTETWSQMVARKAGGVSGD